MRTFRKPQPHVWESRIFHRTACRCEGHEIYSPHTSASRVFRIHRRRAERAGPTRSRSIGRDDTTTEFVSRKEGFFRSSYKVAAICIAAGVRMMIMMDGKINNAMGMIIFTGAL